MWRYTIAFIASSAFVVYVWVLGGGFKTGDGPGFTTLVIMVAVIAVSFEVVIHGFETSSELKELLRREPRFARKVYARGAMFGIASAGVAILASSAFKHEPLSVWAFVLPLLLPAAGFIAGLFSTQSSVRKWLAETRSRSSAKTSNDFTD